MLRLLNIALDEIVLDERARSAEIHAVLRRNSLAVAGGGRIGDRLVLSCESGPVPEICRIAPFCGMSPDEILSELRARYDAGFSVAAVWEYAEQVWGLFLKV